MRSLTLLTLCGLFATAALAETTTSQPSGLEEIDACGTLERSGNCVLFNGGGGKYYVADTGRFKAGDAVRVVGTVDKSCTTICDEADGCVRGAVVYDPAVFPCGTKIPDFPSDIVTNACTAASSALLTLTLAGLWCSRPRRGRGARLL